MTANYPFPVNNEYTAIAIACMNKAMIADMVLPITPVSKKFTWIKHTKEEAFSPPDDRVGRKSAPNQVSFTGSEETDSTEDYALDDPIPQDDIEANNVPGYDVIGKSTEFLMNLLMLKREKRVADLVFDANTYAASNKDQLSGSSQFSDATSKPVDKLLEYLDTPLMRPNLAIFGNTAWRKTRQNPNVIESIKGTGAGAEAAGTVSRQQMAEVLEIDDVVVGQGWINIAGKGQPPNFVRVWGNHIALIYRDVLAGPQRGTTFGFTGQWGGRIAGSQPDGDIGMRGGVKNRVGWSHKEIISAADLGFFVEDAVAA